MDVFMWEKGTYINTHRAKVTKWEHMKKTWCAFWMPFHWRNMIICLCGCPSSGENIIIFFLDALPLEKTWLFSSLKSFHWRKHDVPSWILSSGENMMCLLGCPSSGENMIICLVGCRSTGENMMCCLLWCPSSGENLNKSHLGCLYGRSNMIKCPFGVTSSRENQKHCTRWHLMGTACDVGCSPRCPSAFTSLLMCCQRRHWMNTRWNKSRPHVYAIHIFYRLVFIINVYFPFCDNYIFRVFVEATHYFSFDIQKIITQNPFSNHFNMTWLQQLIHSLIFMTSDDTTTIEKVQKWTDSLPAVLRSRSTLLVSVCLKSSSNAHYGYVISCSDIHSVRLWSAAPSRRYPHAIRNNPKRFRRGGCAFKKFLHQNLKTFSNSSDVTLTWTWPFSIYLRSNVCLAHIDAPPPLKKL